ncbi:hypothetical protein RclHR1_20220004 [Rhizophagus clarus]|uniref:Reverse transcriptase RNase H-like domain-containing protein n=1 Tax=Rhizophagus clarus TaxID=94130 RepID=A0A2Z6RJF7_9GLOM|nr:hypothetical protein RclHR1_20220004 [Rhizophagus clarus]
MNAKVPKGRRARWVINLQQYDFEVIYRSRKENKNADGLSRLRFEKDINKQGIREKQVVEEINKRIVEYNDEDIIILNKSPYCEYFYQQTKSFDRELIIPYGNHKMDEEIFKYKEIIDNTIVIFLENKRCWKNYIEREIKKGNEGHKTSYETLDEKSYKEMVEKFKINQYLY